MSNDSRSLEDLIPPARDRARMHIARCEMEIPGLKMIVSMTYRSAETQHELYQIGRRGIAGEKIVTNADAGDSYHQYRCAYDVFPMLQGKPILSQPIGDEVSDPLWQQIGKIGEEYGLEWAGRWKHNTEGPHFQYTGGMTLASLKDGYVPT